MKMILWIFLLAFGSFAAAEENCKMKEVGTHVQVFCSSFNSADLPMDHVHDFDNFSPGFQRNVRHLEFTNSKISNLQPNAFKYIKKVTQVILSNISLETIDPRAFDGVSRLKLIDLSNNKLTHIPPDVFVSNQLRHLKLDGNPSLVKPTNGPIVHAPWLEWLSLRNCGIEHLSGSAFFKMPLLSHLDISNNHLSQLPEEIFGNLSSLRYLDLSHNDFTTIAINVFNKMPGFPLLPRTVLMAGNKWHCDCKLSPVVSWLTEDIETHAATNHIGKTRLTKAAMCSSPREMSFKPWHPKGSWGCDSSK